MIVNLYGVYAILTQTLRIYMSLVLMYPQLILTPYANEWLQCKHY